MRAVERVSKKESVIFTRNPDHSGAWRSSRGYDGVYSRGVGRACMLVLRWVVGLWIRCWCRRKTWNRMLSCMLIVLDDWSLREREWIDEKDRNLYRRGEILHHERKPPLTNTWSRNKLVFMDWVQLRRYRTDVMQYSAQSVLVSDSLGAMWEGLGPLYCSILRSLAWTCTQDALECLGSWSLWSVSPEAKEHTRSFFAWLR